MKSTDYNETRPLIAKKLFLFFISRAFEPLCFRDKFVKLTVCINSGLPLDLNLYMRGMWHLDNQLLNYRLEIQA